MPKEISNRLGEILIGKGLITIEQYNIALAEQQKRRQLIEPLDNDSKTKSAPLGEILIELGFITRLQLKRGLGWQSFVRKVTFVMSLCAPLFTVSYEAAAATVSLPVTIQAENYSGMSGVTNEVTTDVGGGQNVGYIDTNDWMSYANTSINVPVAGNYTITYRVASLTGGGSFSLQESSTGVSYDTVSVPNTGGWQNWTTITRTITLPVGVHSFKIAALNGGFNINWFSINVVPVPVSVVIQGENYSTMSGVALEVTSDVGGGQNVGWIDAGDSMSYSGSRINIPITGSYKISFRVASVNGGGSFSLQETSTGSTYDVVPVPATGGWQSWVTVERVINLTAGVHSFDIKVINGGFNLNWFKVENITSSSSIAAASSSSIRSIVASSSASSSATVPLPVTIQAENYSGMSGVTNEVTTDVGGGQNVGYIDTNDWMSYANTSINVPVAGSYTITYRVASLLGGGIFSLQESSTGISYDRVSVPNTGGWQNWTTITRTITLPVGVHSFKIAVLSGGFNINWFKIENIAISSSSSSVTSSVMAKSIVASSSAPSSVSISSRSSVSSKSALSGPSSSSTSGVISSNLAGPVNLSWTAPNMRQNGSVLDITEVGGYEIRYKLVSDINFAYVSINNAFTTTYNFAWLVGNYIVQIAAFDKNGLYSDFVDVIGK